MIVLRLIAVALGVSFAVAAFLTSPLLASAVIAGVIVAALTL